MGEVKCYSCFVPSSPGSGSQGGIGLVGAARALGNTEEGLVKVCVGWPERGHGSASAFDHSTGAGHVKPVKGLYHDCIHTKRNTLLLLISEIFGGVNGIVITNTINKCIVHNLNTITINESSRQYLRKR